MAEKKFIDRIKKIDLSDMKILIIGIILLIIPIIILMIISGSNKVRNISAERLKSMVNRKQIFNFTNLNLNGGKVVSSNSSKKRGTRWISDTTVKRVQIELEEAFRIIQRSRRREYFPPGISQSQKQAYRAETNPLICNANGALEEGNLYAAEKFFEQAIDESGNNIFQKVLALSGLCEVYTRMGDKQKAQQAFKLFMDAVAQLPPEMLGANLREMVRNAYIALKSLKDSADPAKVAQQLDKEKLMTAFGLSQNDISHSLNKTLADFPAKFD